MARNSYFDFKQFRIQQGKCAMKVTTDACIFGALLSASPGLHHSRSILDIGTGTGLLSLMAAQNCAATITAIELDEPAAQHAAGNFAASRWAHRLQLVNRSIQTFSLTSSQRFDCIISNPPFFQQSFKGDDHRRNMARHTDSLSFTDLAQAIARHLANHGEAWILLPVASTPLFLQQAVEAGLQLVSQVGLRSSSDHPVHRYILVLQHQGLKPSKEQGSNRCVDSGTLTIYQNHPCYTRQMAELMAPYYINLADTAIA